MLCRHRRVARSMGLVETMLRLLCLRLAVREGVDIVLHVVVTLGVVVGVEELLNLLVGDVEESVRRSMKPPPAHP